MNQLRYMRRGALLIGLYALLVLAPLLIVFAGPLPEGRDFWTEFSVALGFIGLSMMGLQYVITARLRFITAPWGEDVIYHFHRAISILAVVLVLAHPLILFVTRPDTLALLNVFEAPLRARFAVLSVLGLLVMVATSVWRVTFKLNYEAWRLTRSTLAVLVVLLAMGHVLLVGHYMSTPVKQGLWTGYSLFWIVLLVYFRLVKPYLQIRNPYRVAEVRAERGDCTTLVFEPVGHAGLTFKPGQFGWLTLGRNPLDVQEHPFSFSSSAAEAPGRVAMTIKRRGDFTRTVADTPLGAPAYLDAPYGEFSFDRFPAQTYVMLGGGIGITPLMSMIRTLADRGDRAEVVLFYGSVTWEAVTFREELDSLQHRLNLKVVHVIEKPPEGWAGERGYITADLIRRHVPGDLSTHEYFICGPNPMMDAVERALQKLGVPLWRYHSERYSFV